MTSPQDTGSGAAVEERLGFIIYVRVLGEVREKLALESFSIPCFAETAPISIEARFRNEGTVHETPTGAIEVRNLFGALVATGTLPVHNVLPGVVRKVDASVGDGLWLGRYTVILDATYGDKGEKLSAARTIWVVPWRTQGWKALLAVAFLVWVIVARRRFRAFWHVLKTGLPPHTRPRSGRDSSPQEGQPAFM